MDAAVSASLLSAADAAEAADGTIAAMWILLLVAMLAALCWGLRLLVWYLTRD